MIIVSPFAWTRVGALLLWLFDLISGSSILIHSTSLLFALHTYFLYGIEEVCGEEL
jgi:hypothetical protein